MAVAMTEVVTEVAMGVATVVAMVVAVEGDEGGGGDEGVAVWRKTKEVATRAAVEVVMGVAVAGLAVEVPVEVV